MVIPDAVGAQLRVAVVARSERQRRYFAEVLEPHGVQVVADEVLLHSGSVRVDRAVADVLLVDLDEDGSDGDLDIDSLIDEADLPMLFNDGDASKRHASNSIAGRAWGRRLADKLSALVEQESYSQGNSTGGPTLQLVEESRADPGLGSDLGFELDEEFVCDDCDAATLPDSAQGTEACEEPARAQAAPDSDLLGDETDPFGLGALAALDTEPQSDADAADESSLAGMKATVADEEADPLGLADLADFEAVELSDELLLAELPKLGDEPSAAGQGLQIDASEEAEPVALSNELSFEEVPTLSGGLTLSEDLELVELPELTSEGEWADVPNLEMEAPGDFGFGLALEAPAGEPMELEATEGQPGSGSVNAEGAASQVPVWVLGASIGGPQAIKEFIAQLPATTPAVFIVAQHIGTGFVELLASQLDRVTALEVRAAENGLSLRAGQIVVAPVEQRLTFSDGKVELQPNRRKSVYSPSIDEVMTEVARAFGANAHAVVFSGMGSDGVEGARAIVAAGGSVWAQEATSCVISSMADAVRDAGVVSTSAAPVELARGLLASLNGDA